MIQESLFSRYGEYHLTPDYPIDTVDAYVKRVSDVQRAKNWLKAWPQKWLTGEEIKNQANLQIGVPALCRKLRAARQAGELESRIRAGKTYVEYHHKTL